MNAAKQLLVLIMALSLSGCYVIEQGIGQIALVQNIRPFDKVLLDKNTDKKTKEAIILVKKVRQFAQNSLGLTPNEDSYRHYLKVEGSYVAYNLSAAYPLKLEPIVWFFPIVGSVPYLGFFDKNAALEEQDKLKKRKLDTLLRGVSAYSTLGFFPEPLMSTTLDFDEHVIINIIIHEMTHNTVFIKNDVKFNESFASFVGDYGTLLFIKKTKGANSPILDTLQKIKHDKLIFKDFIESLILKLKLLYKDKLLSRQEKLKAKELLFRKQQKYFGKYIKPKLKTRRYVFFEKAKLNNATLLSFARYNSAGNVLLSLLRHFDNDLKKTIRFVRKIQKTNTVEKYIIFWLREKNAL